MCTVSKKKVTWNIDQEFIKKIKKSLKNDKNEIAGVLLFTDTNCNNGVCNKKSTEFKINEGSGSSVYTPNGIINFHTHPKSCYVSENTVYGWPSGEDMAQCINFAKEGTLIHIVFSLEGAYAIGVNKILNKKDIKVLEDVLKTTHVFRSKNQYTQLKNFKKKFNVSGRNTKDIWLKIVNKLTLRKLYTLYNLFNDKCTKVPDDDENIFEVNLIPINNKMKFNAKYISEVCHIKSFGKSLY